MANSGVVISQSEIQVPLVDGLKMCVDLVSRHNFS
jgi:hypothetical protein